jgi:hypothetical protein
MKRLLQSLVGILFNTFFAISFAQTDNGGGMGGTGIKDNSKLMAPAQSDDICTKDRSIGVFQIKSSNDNRIKSQGYVCEGQLLQASSTEIIELQLRLGEKLTVLENSKVRITRSK